MRYALATRVGEVVMPIGTVYRVEVEQETDGRWLADVVDLPGVMAYGDTRGHAIASAEALALRVIADRLEHGGKALARIGKRTGLKPTDL
jgi:predicted RNase H-like HicB family nuclease